MPQWLVPLTDVRFSDEEVEAVAAVYRSGWISQGPRVAAFERAFATFAGADEAVAVASGTAALELGCALLDMHAGDEVVMPSLTFAATAAAVVRAGGTPVFADLAGIDRPWLSAAAAAEAIGERTRALVNVSYGGHPGEAVALRKLADVSGLTLIEDAAHGVGSWAGTRHAGTIGHLGAFSFFANKNLPLGEGGMLVTGDPALARRARLLRSHGLSAGTWERHRGVGADYDVLEPGFNLRLDEPRSALGTLLLKRLAGDNARRAEWAAAYARALGDNDRLRPAITPGPEVTCAWHIFPALLHSRIDRAEFRARLGDAGVQTSIHYPPLHRTAAFSGYARRALPVTDEYARGTVTLPLFAHMSDSQHARVLDAAMDAVR